VSSGATAAVLRAIGEPLFVEELELADPREGEVLVEMAASGVCASCLHAQDGSHSGIPLPIVLGDEGAGIVKAVGPGCRTLRPGDHVILSWAPGCDGCEPCLQGRPALCQRQPPFGVLADGTARFGDGGAPVFHYGPATYASAVVVSERAAVPIADDVPLEVAALIGCAVTAGFGAVANSAGLRAGQSVAVVGCGGVGLAAIQAAAALGAGAVVAVVTNAA
jgi:S-(hydroxymethyl)glutathione dehydrogenase/alcohol dehydrogenase